MDFMGKKFMSELPGLVYVRIKFNISLAALVMIG